MDKVILLADDDVDDFEIFKEALDRSDCAAELHRAKNGLGVFDYLNSPDNARPDIIFLDLNMPVMNGWQCLAKLKNTSGFEDIPVVIYTTSSHKRDLEIASDLKAHGVITKPSNPAILTKVLRRIICSLGTDDLRQALREAHLLTHE